jgi:glutathione synthase/RimK-type ligase-like ATP-grasp enzyme
MQTAEPAQLRVGLARLAKLAFEGADLAPLREELYGRAMAGRNGAGALMDLAHLEQLFGNTAGGLACQRAALDEARLYRAPAPDVAPSLRVLALAAPGDVGTNAPLEFLLEGSDIALDMLYVVPGAPSPAPLPPFDLAIVAAGESDANQPALAEMARLAATWPVPTLNDPARIARLSRDHVAALMADATGVFSVKAQRLARRDLAAAPLPFPFILRPVDSHAGRGLARIDGRETLATYLAARGENAFFATPFVDYRSADGLFRKYRIAFIAGRPYACHMAISDLWMIYYLNAGMRESSAKRDEEARFMATFDEDFACRHRAALAAIAERIGLDYFAIDCGEMPDGRLLLFEADVAMIVHAMDPPDLFPYKAPQMRKVFAAFAAMLKRRAGK